MKRIIGTAVILGVLLTLCVGIVNAQTSVDSDGDGFLDQMDNCLVNHNVPQEDADQDSIGDACETPDQAGANPDYYIIKLDCSLLFFLEPACTIRILVDHRGALPHTGIDTHQLLARAAS